MNKNSTLLALGLTLLSLLPAQASAAPSAQKSIVIAQLSDLSGNGADFGRDFSVGAKVYFDHVNASGGIKGKRIVYRSSDTGGQAVHTLSGAQSALSERSDAILFGITGDQTVESLARDNRLRSAGTPLFGAVTANTSLGLDDGVFYLRASLADEVQAIVRQLKNLGVATFGLAAAGEQISDAVKLLEKEATAQGARLVGHVALPTSAEGSAAAADKLMSKKPQAVIVIGDTLSAAQFFKRYRSLDPGTFLCAPSMVNAKTLIATIGPQAARGLIISQVVPAPEATLDISREHRKLMDKYADEPASPATLEGFIAAKLLVNSLQKSADASAASLRQTLQGEGRINLGGYELNFNKGTRASHFVELSVINRDGRLLR